MPGHGETIFALTTPGVTRRSRSRQQIDEPYAPPMCCMYVDADR
jgi:hypothetical protein